MNKDFLIWIAIGAMVIAATGAGVYLMTRGIRNNNPGNIRHNPSNQWQGMRTQQTDPEYVQFNDPVYGIRAMARTLKNYEIRHGLRTVRAIITRWAPPSENLTDSYIDHVSRVLGVRPDDAINVQAEMVPLVIAIIKHENGEQPYSSDQISRGISLA